MILILFKGFCGKKLGFGALFDQGAFPTTHNFLISVDFFDFSLGRFFEDHSQTFY